MSNIIRFVSNKPGLTNESTSVPSPIMKTIPEWYRKADRFAKKLDGTFWKGPDNGKVPTWKACPAIFDIMGTGYTLKTPCDIEFIEKDSKTLSVTIYDSQYKEFCTPRQKMPQFENPAGYHESHFAWFPDWGIETPEGYSVLYSQPFNRFELPFLTTSGIIDNEIKNSVVSINPNPSSGGRSADEIQCCQNSLVVKLTRSINSLSPKLKVNGTMVMLYFSTNA